MPEPESGRVGLPRPEATRAEVTVTFSRQTTTAWVGTADDLITGLLAQGVSVPFSCREGDCSSCIALLIAGEVRALGEEHVLTPQDVAAGYVVPCRVAAASPSVELSFDE